jgi:hypothetical protein
VNVATTAAADDGVISNALPLLLVLVAVTIVSVAAAGSVSDVDRGTAAAI